MDDAIFAFKCAGFILLGLVVVLGMFGRWIKVIPFGSAAAAFGFVLFVLHIILGFFYWIQASHLSAGTQDVLKDLVLGGISLLCSCSWYGLKRPMTRA
jgi:predicted membrane channel-forming protein YqfA (hemolysin III family)